ncbi:hypothetical protein [Picosynechococcus sp. PCC 8807]|uniref:hypothetical protein n=1 Tax=Picosynechococcus sp. PCC 8807 TaxID=195248 RepID=UPI000810C24F|nr:hypothetical protein AWQ24_14915 [Picosynechococcus sp. PCC 8807]
MPLERKGLNQLVTTAITRGEWRAFEQLRAERGGMAKSALLREALQLLLEQHGYLPTDTKKVS